MTKNHLTKSLAVAFALAVPALTNGCGDDNPLCCTEFKPGATVNASIGGDAKAQVAVQAVADFAGIASAAITDLGSACRSIAEGLDVPKDKIAAAEGAGAGGDTDAVQRAQMDAYCKLALDAIASFKATAGGSITVEAQPPKCNVSASAKASCQAKCDVSGECKASAKLPECKGGELQVSCKGSCTAKAGATLTCEGKCEGSCKGSCTAQGGVQCAGKCNGTCEGSGGAGTSGVDAQGNCQGTCKGTCEVTAPGVTCEGSCKGECGGSCTASANASVTCNGECQGEVTPLKCEGGQLEGGCNVDAKCDANCNASVQAKAECTPPAIVVNISGAANVEAAAKLQAVFEANLGVVFAFKSRLEAMGKLTGTIVGNADAIVDIKAACIIQVGVSAKKAADDVIASAEVTGKLVTASTQ